VVNTDSIDKKLASLEQRISRLQSFVTSRRGSSNHEATQGIHSEKDYVRPESLFEGLFVRKLSDLSYRVKTDSNEGRSFDLILENTTDPVVETDLSGIVQSVNISAQHLLGYTIDETRDTSLFSLIADSYRPHMEHAYDRLREQGKNQSRYPSDVFPLQVKTKEGTVHNVESMLFSYIRDEEERTAVLMRQTHISHRLISELNSLKSQYTALSETLYDAILQINQDFKITFANSAVQKLFGYDKNELIGSSFKKLFPEALHTRYFDDFQKYFFVDENDREQLGLDNTLEVIGLKKDNESTLYELSFGNSRGLNDQRMLTCVIRDITQRKNAERKLRTLAYYDTLTHAGNRDLFYTDISDLIEKTMQEESKAAILFLDLDNFKRVNDTMGHSQGDELLITAANRIRDCLRDQDTLYRWGGDEFVVLLSQISKVEDASRVADRVLDKISAPYYLDSVTGTEKQKVNLGTSMGISVIPDDGTTPDQILQNGDIAMYRAKEGGKNRYFYFDSHMNEQERRKWYLEKGLRHLIETKSFAVHYQPLVNSQGHIKGAEALVRWQLEDETYVSPGEFIPVAEETNLIVPLGTAIFEQVCQDLSQWNEKYPDFYIAYNLSAKQFEDDQLVHIIGTYLEQYDINPKNLKLEITESSVMQTPVQSIQKIEELKNSYPGIQFAIDDFGTGYSSLNYLSTLPADTLKIDQSFIMNIDENNNRKIVDTIISLAHTLELDIVAEGVETAEHVDYLKTRQCEYLQGFYYKKAVSAEEFSQLLEKRVLP
jgi:diguanylate cyclase (GGDEF)-like protein/PAS domain S-box-containing protein